MTTIYLIRHAEAEGNLYRIAQGQANSILTDRGWQQVRALSRRFADIPVDAVYASDLYRTCATASAIYRPKGLPLHRRRDLREICVGKWEEKTWGEIARRDPEQLENFTHRLHLWHTAGAETPGQVQARLLAALRDIAAACEGETAAVFSHGCAIRLLLAALQGIPLEELGRTPTGTNTAVSLLRAEGDRIEVVYRDDAAHLTDPAFTQGHAVVRRANGLEPGLYFGPPAAGQAALLSRWAGQPVNLPAGVPALMGYRLDGTPVGAVAFDDAREAADGCGWISLLAVDSPWRHRGYGVQFIGQAVMHFRPMGRDRLRLSPPDTEEARSFCREYGFAPAADGSGAWEKGIGYAPEFLGDGTAGA